MPQSSIQAVNIPDECQRALASKLNIVLTADEDVNPIGSVVFKINQKLGSKAIEEQARWYVLSVYRHLAKARWSEPAASGLPESRQYSLALDCLGMKGFKKSLQAALKNDRCKYTLLEFRRNKNTDQRILSPATNAYKHAASVLKEEGLIQAVKKPIKDSAVETNGKPEKKPAQTKRRVVNRRAERRAYPADEFLSDVAAKDLESTKPAIRSVMSDEEFSDLESAIANSKDATQKSWSFRGNDERWSLIMGLAAGAGFFILILLLFL
ncbi:MAG: hypothetical protein COA96_06440 [SAR86 cluster bacterium]|uniref:Uncharacterized protein n=1 Tax=SAR86 cluster bacterium TaxID=2030880 RepID=A0A2A5B3G9_9GAMM|nr:MAG: hypothetical protein COA96_06440 [SAR86 cluster bacterium]